MDFLVVIAKTTISKKKNEFSYKKKIKSRNEDIHTLSHYHLERNCIFKLYNIEHFKQDVFDS